MRRIAKLIGSNQAHRECDAQSRGLSNLSRKRKKPLPQFVPVDSGRWDRKSKRHAGKTANPTCKRKGEVCERNRTMALAGSRKSDRRHCTRGTFPSFGEAGSGPNRGSNIVVRCISVHRCRVTNVASHRVGCVASRDHREWDDTLAQGQ